MPPVLPTRASLADDLAELGVRPGAVVLVHARMSAVGDVEQPPGAPARDPVAEPLLGALRDVLGRRGTVVVPSFTEGNSMSSRVHRRRTAGMTAAQRTAFRTRMPAFEADHSPSDGMGRFAETVRRAAGARRSGHPQTSFVALGARAPEAVARHGETCHLGEESPLRWLYDVGARVLLIGVGYQVCSAFHLAEYRLPNPPRRDYACVVVRKGKAVWISYEDVDLDDTDFTDLGTDYEKSDLDRNSSRILRGPVGGAETRSLVMRDAVDFAVPWLSEKRPRGTLPT
ncbi:AAC(3) family N-acetyltransferase [Streptomyces sp. SL13]|uniref:Aminoglycoside N(3)-acetyltransferase n=1 Tax=Streptantibioticus silvisoli TaxID=2705255 RepID=A0AA90GTM9_9ACTN|nr:AAC(3) family N-acetyltransferase [Streptantibioticus silvisoli]MDI5962336.1 AAC(3) family N-acetyltransferase [Streptantibioticus silvisoli]MDI5967848.1 AAC(3) family N-acetyltransferase [Streptantibioticus silvisoli]